MPKTWVRNLRWAYELGNDYCRSNTQVFENEIGQYEISFSSFLSFNTLSRRMIKPECR